MALRAPKKAAAPSSEAANLIQRARNHPLGIAFLRNGMLDSVAAIFKVHSFTVERARESLAKEEKVQGRRPALRS